MPGLFYPSVTENIQFFRGKSAYTSGGFVRRQRMKNYISSIANNLIFVKTDKEKIQTSSSVTIRRALFAAFFGSKLKHAFTVLKQPPQNRSARVL